MPYLNKFKNLFPIFIISVDAIKSVDPNALDVVYPIGQDTTAVLQGPQPPIASPVFSTVQPQPGSVQTLHILSTQPSQQVAVSQMPPQPQLTGNRHPKAEVIITEQPASKALRFRYECEGRSAGSIPGANSTPENKTFPTIQIVGYKGRAVVVVSCVTKDEWVNSKGEIQKGKYLPHPHNLVGKEGCKKGVCTIQINNDDMTVTFSNLGIQCVKKKDIEEHLKIRKAIKVDPFMTGFDHGSNPSSIDLNVVRLCFQVFLESPEGGYKIPLRPVVSEPIYDKKAMSELTICKLSDCTSPATGGKEIILLCEKVRKTEYF